MKSNKLTIYLLKYNQQTLNKQQKIVNETKKLNFNKTNSK